MQNDKTFIWTNCANFVQSFAINCKSNWQIQLSIEKPYAYIVLQEKARTNSVGAIAIRNRDTNDLNDEIGLTNVLCPYINFACNHYFLIGISINLAMRWVGFFFSFRLLWPQNDMSKYTYKLYFVTKNLKCM